MTWLAETVGYTPGPWHVTAEHPGDEEGWRDIHAIGSVDAIAQYVEARDATLICAAPELAETLRDLSRAADLAAGVLSLSAPGEAASLRKRIAAAIEVLGRATGLPPERL
jgi:hypothetical protein